MRALFVDDDPISALLYTEACRLVPGWEPSVAGSLAEARALLAGEAIVLAVVDRHLPDGLGTELLDHPALASALCIVCSGDVGLDGLPAAQAIGADEQWSKPLDLQRLLDTLRRLGPAS